MGNKLKSYDDKTLNLVAGNTNVATFESDYGFLPIAEPLTMDKFVELRNEESLTSAYKMFSGKGVIEQPKVTFPTPNNKAIEFLRNNPDQKAAFEQKYGPGSSANYISNVEGN